LVRRTLPCAANIEGLLDDSDGSIGAGAVLQGDALVKCAAPPGEARAPRAPSADRILNRIAMLVFFFGTHVMQRGNGLSDLRKASTTVPDQPWSGLVSHFRIGSTQFSTSILRARSRTAH
jgi:hypothetical protein